MKSNKPTPGLLLESIRIENGVPDLLKYHQQRVDRSRRWGYPKSPALKLTKLLQTIDLPARGVYKLRIEYGAKLHRYRIAPYTKRPVGTIRIVDADDLRYGRKFAERTDIEQLMQRRGESDDVLLVQRGHVTDTSYANVALYDGSHWYTPAWPLLRGTRREQLLDDGTLRASVIRERDLHNFGKMRLVNALLPWGVGPEVRIEEVRR